MKPFKKILALTLIGILLLATGIPALAAGDVVAGENPLTDVEHFAEEVPSSERETNPDELPPEPTLEPISLEDELILPLPTNQFAQIMPMASVGTWTEYGRSGHASASGDSVSFSGHPQVPFTSLLFNAANDGDYRILTFHLTEGNSDWHTCAATR